MDKVQLEDGRTIPASQYGENVEHVSIGELSSTEHDMVGKLKVVHGCICFEKCISVYVGLAQLVTSLVASTKLINAGSG